MAPKEGMGGFNEEKETLIWGPKQGEVGTDNTTRKNKGGTIRSTHLMFLSRWGKNNNGVVCYTEKLDPRIYEADTILGEHTRNKFYERRRKE